MKKILNLKQYLFSPLLAIAVVCFLIAGISFVYSSKHSVTKKVLPAKQILTPAPTENAKDLNTQEQITVVITQVPVQTTTAPIQTTTNNSAPQTTNTPIPSKTANIQINEPDGTFNFSVNFNSDTNPCSILNNAKDEGKIRSLNIQHYNAPLNSDYVKEMNGYNNNWTFKINGDQKPTGCSNYSLNSGDTVTWKYN